MFNSLKKSLKRAFTITELVIVIAVIAILAAILIPTFANVISSANKSAALSTCRNALTDLEGQMAQDGKTSEDLYGTVFESDDYFYVFFNGELTYLGNIEGYADGALTGTIECGDGVSNLGYASKTIAYGGTTTYSATWDWFDVTVDEEKVSTNMDTQLSTAMSVENEKATATTMAITYIVTINGTTYYGCAGMEFVASGEKASYTTENALYSFGGVVTSDVEAPEYDATRANAAAGALTCIASGLTAGSYTIYVESMSRYYAVTYKYDGSNWTLVTVIASNSTAYAAATYYTSDDDAVTAANTYFASNTNITANGTYYIYVDSTYYFVATVTYVSGSSNTVSGLTATTAKAYAASGSKLTTTTTTGN